MNRTRSITIALLLMAAAVAVTAMVHGAGRLAWNWFYPWVLLPYLVLFACFCLPRSTSQARDLGGIISALLVLILTALFYIDAMWFSSSSTSALVFVFAPLWLLLIGLLVGGLGAWVAGRMLRP